MTPRDAAEPLAPPIPAAALPPPEGARWWRLLRRNRGFRWAMAGLIALLLIVTAGPWISPYSEHEQSIAFSNKGATAQHWLGYDTLGRDLMTRILYGGRISLAVGVVGALVSLLIGVTVGGIAGMAGGWVEQAIMRLIDFLYGVPLLLVVIALMVVLGSGLSNVFVALGLVYWLQMARVVRSRVAELRSRDFVEAARALGAGPVRVFLRHILPNTAGVIVVTATFMVPLAIFTESFLSFLGLGVQQPHASWGTLAAEGFEAMRAAPHVMIWPSLAICVTMFLFQTLGEALRRALNPRHLDRD
jgi:oligopeptide transport system permease protein